MSEEFITIKPSFYGLSLNFNALWRRRRRKKSAVEIVGERFLKIFGDHGVQVAQIPRFLPQVTLDMLLETKAEALLPALIPDVLDQTAALFGVRRDWLDGADSRMYEVRYCYKQPELLFEHLAQLRASGLSAPIFAFYSGKPRSGHVPDFDQLALVVAEKIGAWGEDERYRYYPYGDAWAWRHAPCRIQLKAMARLLYRELRRSIPLYQVSSAVLKAVTQGECVPRPYIGKQTITDPALEDYALSANESAVAKEIEELPRVLNYMEKVGLSDLAKQCLRPRV